MATIFAHGLAATAICYGTSNNKPSWFLTRTLIYCSILPDLDVLAFRFGIAYGEFWGHRGFTHSIVFALIVSLVVGCILKVRLVTTGYITCKNIFLVFLATMSHGFLDSLTNGGLGIAAFSPFDNKRYFLPWRVLEVSPIGGAFFSERGMAVIINEAVWIGIPSLLLILIAKRFRNRNNPA